ncbi:MAG: PhoH family protein [Acidobacteria bacterium]|nr:PhoH family protein [Acidobacteriota bacterium]MCG3194851.1 PhoH-like protein [Thermoanaerobaculia bacterium]
MSLPESGLSVLFGVRDENLRLLEEAFDVEISARGGELILSGEEKAAAVVARLLEEFSHLVERGFTPKKPEFAAAIRVLKENPEASLSSLFESRSVSPALRQVVSPRSLRQQEYLSAIAEHDIVFGIGPAGTGKTYLAVAMAAAALLEKRVKRIVLCRPAVEAGEKLGFLPGDLAEKVNPYLRPLHDALYDILGYDKVGKLLERNIIEIAPLAFMRGRTLNDAFIILDEAQNTTSEQMKMFLTRIGFGSKAVVTGDVTQIDLPQGKVSGLREADRVLSGVPQISFVRFDQRDVVRHPIVQAIVNAYEEFDKTRPVDATGRPRAASDES